MSGFAIFSILGYMSQKQGVDIASVAESGRNVESIEFKKNMSSSCLTYYCRYSMNMQMDVLKVQTVFPL